jgi:hypothetical protein
MRHIDPGYHTRASTAFAPAEGRHCSLISQCRKHVGRDIVSGERHVTYRGELDRTQRRPQ